MLSQEGPYRTAVDGIHHLAQNKERRVDGLAFVQPHGVVAGPPVVLRTRQVDQVELSPQDLLGRAVFDFDLQVSQATPPLTSTPRMAWDRDD